MNFVSQNGDDSSGLIKKGPVGMTVEQYKQRTSVPNKIVLVNFFADWCVVCKKEKPILEQIKNEMQSTVEVLEIDMEENPLIAAYFEVDGLPINFLYKNGVLIWDHMGLVSKKEITDVVYVYNHGNK